MRSDCRQSLPNTLRNASAVTLATNTTRLRSECGQSLPRPKCAYQLYVFGHQSDAARMDRAEICVLIHMANHSSAAFVADLTSAALVAEPLTSNRLTSHASLAWARLRSASAARSRRGKRIAATVCSASKAVDCQRRSSFSPRFSRISEAISRTSRMKGYTEADQAHVLNVNGGTTYHATDEQLRRFLTHIIWFVRNAHQSRICAPDTCGFPAEPQCPVCSGAAFSRLLSQQQSGCVPHAAAAAAPFYSSSLRETPVITETVG